MTSQKLINNGKKLFYSIDNDEDHVIHSKGDNIQIKINNEVDAIISVAVIISRCNYEVVVIK